MKNLGVKLMLSAFDVLWDANSSFSNDRSIQFQSYS